MKDFEIERECQEGQWLTELEDCPWVNTIDRPKLTNGFITVAKKEPIIYTEEEVESLLLQFAIDCEKDEDLICYDGHINGVRQYNDLNKWFEQNKKK
jgi:hypothetical protein